MYDEETEVVMPSSVETRTLFVAAPSTVSHYTGTAKPHKACACVLMVMYWGLLGHHFGFGLISLSHSFGSSELGESKPLHAPWCSFLIQDCFKRCLASPLVWGWDVSWWDLQRISSSRASEQWSNMILAPNLCCFYLGLSVVKSFCFSFNVLIYESQTDTIFTGFILRSFFASLSATSQWLVFIILELKGLSQVCVCLFPPLWRLSPTFFFYFQL